MKKLLLSLALGTLIALGANSAYAKKHKAEPTSSPKVETQVTGDPNEIVGANSKSKIFHKKGCKDFDCKNCVKMTRKEAIEKGYRENKKCK